MRVLMIKTVAKLGKSGSVVNVADGFARNFLFPQNLAKPATDSAIKSLLQTQQKMKREETKRLVGSRKVSSTLKQ